MTHGGSRDAPTGPPTPNNKACSQVLRERGGNVITCFVGGGGQPLPCGKRNYGTLSNRAARKSAEWERQQPGASRPRPGSFAVFTKDGPRPGPLRHWPLAAAVDYSPRDRLKRGRLLSSFCFLKMASQAVS